MTTHLMLLALLTTLQDWPHWRGPSHDGSSAVSGLPRELTAEAGLCWAADLPGPGAATPIVFGERVFVTAAVEEAGLLLALCYDRASGALRWEHEAGSGYQPRGRGSKTSIDERSDYASPSPVTDGERVVFLFGNGDLVCTDLDGKRQWAKNLQQEYGDFAFQWTYGSSPTLHEGRLYLPILQRDQPTDGTTSAEKIPSFLLALETATGKEAFVAERPSPAQMESLESYATVIPNTLDGRTELLVVGGDVLTGHDPATGKELWRWGTWNEGHREKWWRIVPSPVAMGGTVLVSAPKRAPVYAVKLSGSIPRSPDMSDDVLWQSSGRPNPVSSDVPTPLAYQERFFVLSESGKLSRVKPGNGQVEWTIELPDRTPWEASPTGADERVWCLSHGGVLVSVEAKSGALVTRTELGEEDGPPVRASVAAAHGALFVRTQARLVCLGG
jgi:outer membrane protein assembly factor BamB